ncbi:MAG: glutathione S-transferase family protein [Alphaproteobacteria bacterium]|nr:glutathione S-transferase family protein [Alphaproteobacteria bacterium]
MTIKLYDLAAADGRRFSGNCWRTQLALAHKGLAYETVPTRFVDIASIGNGTHKTIPMIDDGGKEICDSWVIANYLEETYPDTPSLFGDGGANGPGRSYSQFLQHWNMRAISFPLLHIIIKDIYDRLDPADQPYFRESREKRFGKTLEQMVENREETLKEFQSGLNPLRTCLEDQPFLCGAAPLYPDYIVAGQLLWPRPISPLKFLEDDDVLTAWFSRILGLFDGLAAQQPKEWDGV